MNKNKNLFSLMDMSVSDIDVRNLYDIHDDEHLNNTVLNRYKEAEKLVSPVNSKEIDKDYKDLEDSLKRKLACRGLKW